MRISQQRLEAAQSLLEMLQSNLDGATLKRAEEILALPSLNPMESLSIDELYALSPAELYKQHCIWRHNANIACKHYQAKLKQLAKDQQEASDLVEMARAEGGDYDLQSALRLYAQIKQEMAAAKEELEIAMMQYQAASQGAKNALKHL